MSFFHFWFLVRMVSFIWLSAFQSFKKISTFLGVSKHSGVQSSHRNRLKGGRSGQIQKTVSCTEFHGESEVIGFSSGPLWLLAKIQPIPWLCWKIICSICRDVYTIFTGLKWQNKYCSGMHFQKEAMDMLPQKNCLDTTVHLAVARVLKLSFFVRSESRTCVYRRMQSSEWSARHPKWKNTEE